MLAQKVHRQARGPAPACLRTKSRITVGIAALRPERAARGARLIAPDNDASPP